MSDDDDIFLGLLTGRIQPSNEPIPQRPSRFGELKPDRKPCPRCRGRGRIESFRHVQGGECFACEGTGDADHFHSRRVIHGGDTSD